MDRDVYRGSVNRKLYSAAEPTAVTTAPSVPTNSAQRTTATRYTAEAFATLARSSRTATASVAAANSEIVTTRSRSVPSSEMHAAGPPVQADRHADKQTPGAAAAGVVRRGW